MLLFADGSFFWLWYHSPYACAMWCRVYTCIHGFYTCGHGGRALRDVVAGTQQTLKMVSEGRSLK